MRLFRVVPLVSCLIGVGCSAIAFAVPVAKESLTSLVQGLSGRVDVGDKQASLSGQLPKACLKHLRITANGAPDHNSMIVFTLIDADGLGTGCLETRRSQNCAVDSCVSLTDLQKDEKTRAQFQTVVKIETTDMTGVKIGIRSQKVESPVQTAGAPPPLAPSSTRPQMPPSSISSARMEAGVMGADCMCGPGQGLNEGMRRSGNLPQIGSALVAAAGDPPRERRRPEMRERDEDDDRSSRRPPSRSSRRDRFDDEDEDDEGPRGRDRGGSREPRAGGGDSELMMLAMMMSMQNSGGGMGMGFMTGMGMGGMSLGGGMGMSGMSGMGLAGGGMTGMSFGGGGMAGMGSMYTGMSPMMSMNGMGSLGGGIGNFGGLNMISASLNPMTSMGSMGGLGNMGALGGSSLYGNSLFGSPLYGGGLNSLYGGGLGSLYSMNSMPSSWSLMGGLNMTSPFQYSLNSMRSTLGPLSGRSFGR